jgi:HEAT repeat protein
MFFFSSAELIKAVESAMPHILEVLKDTDPQVRNEALSTLGEISKQCK